MAEGEKNQEEKTEEPTQKRMEDAREEGNVPRSVELSSMMVLLTGVLALYFTGSGMWDSMKEASHQIFGHAVDWEINTQNITAYASAGIFFMLRLMAPMFLILAIVGVLTGVAQSGPNLTVKPLMPKFNKMDPIKGAKRVFFSARALVEMVKSVLKVLMVAALSVWTISGMFGEYILLLDKEVGQFFLYLMKQIFYLSLRIAILLLLLAVLDYIWQRYRHRKELRMSRQEVKDERKQQEGDPQVRSRIRSIMMETARKRMMQDVKEADAVVTNPVHVAVALKYDQATMAAPMVVAKGKRLLAEKIKEIARANDIPIIEDPPLARTLFKACEVGGEVPAHLYKAVAEVLAYVYRLKNRKVS